MQLTKYADYSIRTLIYLAERPGQKVPINAIADAYGISRNHLMKVSQNLARLNYIVGYRGKGGGISLARPAKGINIGQLLGQVEPYLRGIEPALLPDVTPSDGRFHAALSDARGACLDSLSRLSLADIVTATPGHEGEQGRIGADC